MARFVVMEKPGEPERAVFIRDGFSVVGLVVPLLWLLWHRLWFLALAALALLALAAALAFWLKFPALLIAAEIALALSVALEGATLRCKAARFAGWQDAAVIHAESAEEAEIRHFGAVAPAIPRPIRNDMTALQSASLVFPGYR
jgi:hypothetical protein